MRHQSETSKEVVIKTQKYIKTIAELRTALKNSIEHAGHQTERHQKEVKELLEALRELYICQWTTIGSKEEAIRKTQKVLQKYETIQSKKIKKEV